MPDKWSTRGNAAWDLAFHVLALTLVDDDFGKQQLDLMLGENYLHPSGQIPAYEWNFGERQPAGPRVGHHLHLPAGEDAPRPGRPRLARALLPQAAAQLHLVGEPQGTGPARNAFEGGFLGLDNIGVFDRSAPLPTGGIWNRPTAPPGLALFCMNMTEIAVELALHRPAYAEDVSQVRRTFLVDRPPR